MKFLSKIQTPYKRKFLSLLRPHLGRFHAVYNQDKFVFVLFVGRGIYNFDIVTASGCPFGREVATSAVL